MDFCSRLKFHPCDTLPLISPRSDNVDVAPPRREATYAGRVLNPHLRLYKRSPTSVWDFRTLYENRQVELMPTPDHGLPALGDRLNRLAVWTEFDRVHVREQIYLPDVEMIQEESNRYKKQRGRRAYERMFAGGNEVILGTPDDLITPSPWQPPPTHSISSEEWEQITVQSARSGGSRASSESTVRPPSTQSGHAPSVVGNGQQSQNADRPKDDADEELTNVTKRTFSGSTLPAISKSKASKPKAVSVSKQLQEWHEHFPGLRLRPLLIKNARHRAICNPGGKKWQPVVKPISYKNFVLPSVSFDGKLATAAASAMAEERSASDLVPSSAGQMALATNEDSESNQV